MSERLLKPCVFWFVGLNGSGKTTLGHELAAEFGLMHLDDEFGWQSMIRGLDMDNEEHVMESEWRAGVVASWCVSRNTSVVCTFNSFWADSRGWIRELVELAGGRFIEIFADCAPDECSRRAGWHVNNDGFEAPEGADLHLDTEHFTVGFCMTEIFSFLRSQSLVGSAFR